MNNMNFLPGEKISQPSDTELMRICRDCGSNIRKLLKEFAVLLLEVEKRRLYRAHDFHSVYEFAAKVAGMNRLTVDSILHLGEKLEDKPVLRALIGECGWGKLQVVAAIATPETQDFWAEKVKTLPMVALQTFVSEVRKQEIMDAGGTGQADLVLVATDRGMHAESAKTDQSALFTNSLDIDELRIDSANTIVASQKSNLSFKLDVQTETNLRIFKQRLEKQTGEVQDWNFVMKKLLEIAGEHKECETARSKKRVAQTVPTVGDLAPTREQQLATLREKIKNSLPEVSKRHIPAMVKKYLQLKYDGKCGFPNCKNPAEIMHHVRRFVLVPNHDPDKIVPLCKKHERLAHQSLIENEDGPPETWKIRMQPDKNSPKYKIDLKVNAFRMPDSS